MEAKAALARKLAVIPDRMWVEAIRKVKARSNGGLAA
jgi:hypothetical protein